MNYTGDLIGELINLVMAKERRANGTNITNPSTGHVHTVWCAGDWAGSTAAPVGSNATEDAVSKMTNANRKEIVAFITKNCLLVEHEGKPAMYVSEAVRACYLYSEKWRDEVKMLLAQLEVEKK